MILLSRQRQRVQTVCSLCCRAYSCYQDIFLRGTLVKVTINHSYIPSTQNAAPSIRRRLLSSTSSSSTSSNPTKATFLHQYFASNSSPWLREIARLCLTGLAAFGTGFACGRFGERHRDLEDASSLHLVPTKHALPSGIPRTCCEERSNSQASKPVLTDLQQTLPHRLQQIVGRENVVDGQIDTAQSLPFLKGARLGFGHCLCIVTPTRLQDVVDCVQAIVDAGCVIIPQGRNTGLTGGSVPREHSADTRPAVILSMKHLDRIFPLDDGQRVVCLAGTGLASLQHFLTKYFPNRESHSVLGSTFLNPTTAAGVSLGSGGTQCRKGPAYTERALYLTISTNKWQENVIQVHNTLGVDKLSDGIKQSDRERKMDMITSRVDRWSRWIHDGYARDMRYSTKSGAGLQAASDVTYAQRLCDHTDSSKDAAVSRYNADTSGPEYNRSEGKTIILATVHDTFPKPSATKTFWISFESLDTALDFRRHVCLDNAQDLPISVEYLNRDAFDVIDEAGRVIGNAIKLFGTTSPFVTKLWNFKLWIEALPLSDAPFLVDKFLFAVNHMLPRLLPSQIDQLGRKLDHHVSMTVGEFGSREMDRVLQRMYEFVSKQGDCKIMLHECKSSSEVNSLQAFRFIAAPAFRTWCIGKNVQGMSVDYVLPKTGGQIPLMSLDGNETRQVLIPVKRMRYSHFACNVVHEDLAFSLDVDADAVKDNLKNAVEAECGGKLPAEHGHGTEYIAPSNTKERWQRTDPLNVLNPGVGGTSTKFKYGQG
jgi:D-lactate dehydrogenase (quinone)